MGLIVSEGQEYLAAAGVADLNADSALRLFKNNVTIALATVLADLTECDAPGYVEVDLTAEWSAPSLNGLSKWETSTAQMSFVGSGGTPQLVYGYYIVAGGTTVIAAGNFDAAFTFENNLDTVNVTPRVTFNEE